MNLKLLYLFLTLYCLGCGHIRNFPFRRTMFTFCLTQLLLIDVDENQNYYYYALKQYSLRDIFNTIHLIMWNLQWPLK